MYKYSTDQHVESNLLLKHLQKVFRSLVPKISTDIEKDVCKGAGGCRMYEDRKPILERLLKSVPEKPDATVAEWRMYAKDVTEFIVTFMKDLDGTKEVGEKHLERHFDCLLLAQFLTFLSVRYMWPALEVENKEVIPGVSNPELLNTMIAMLPQLMGMDKKTLKLACQYPSSFYLKCTTALNNPQTTLMEELGVFAECLQRIVDNANEDMFSSAKDKPSLDYISRLVYSDIYGVVLDAYEKVNLTTEVQEEIAGFLTSHENSDCVDDNMIT